VVLAANGDRFVRQRRSAKRRCIPGHSGAFGSGTGKIVQSVPVQVIGGSHRCSGTVAIREITLRTHISGLDEYGLSPTELHHLGATPVRLSVYFSFPRVTAKWLPLSPKQRNAKIEKCLRQALRSFQSRWPSLKAQIIGSRIRPKGLALSIPAREVSQLTRAPFLAHIFVDGVQGQARRHTSVRQKLRWFAVRAWVALEREDLASGLQTLEDRIVLIKAASHEDAVRRLRGEWRRYARPYLNPAGVFVRWHLDEIVESFETTIDPDGQLDPRGVEVWSSLSRRRRLKPRLAWSPSPKDFRCGPPGPPL